MRKISLFVLGASLLCAGVGLSGCATISHTAENKVDYEFLDSQGDYRLVERNNDIYMEKLDGSESRQITHTPNVREEFALFSKTGKYILIEERYNLESNPKYYLIKFDSDDSTKKEIPGDEAVALEIND